MKWLVEYLFLILYFKLLLGWHLISIQNLVTLKTHHSFLRINFVGIKNWSFHSHLKIIVPS